MHAPLSVVNLHDGTVIELSSFYEAKPLVLVFLRHFGCIFCREQVAVLRDRPDLNVAFVTMGTVPQAEQFKQMMESPHAFISDPNKTLYAAFGLVRGSFTQMFSPSTFKRGFEATRAGHKVGRPIGDPWQLAGAFLIDQSGLVMAEHRSRDAGDNLNAADVEKWLSGVEVVTK
jgi:hypothetical protein